MTAFILDLLILPSVFGISKQVGCSCCNANLTSAHYLGKLIAKLSGHTRSVEDLVISPDGQFMYSCSSDTSIRKWDLSSLEEVAIFEGHQTSVYRMTASFDDDILWSGRKSWSRMRSFNPFR